MSFSPLQTSHEEALAEFVGDFKSAGEESIPALFRHPDWSHPELVDYLEGWSQGVDRSPEATRLFKDMVPCTTRFLTDAGGQQLLGVVNVRHRLNEFLERFGGHIGYSVRPSARRQGHATRLLREGLRIARAQGIERAMLTCHPDNLGSARAIERCGGILAESYFHDPMQTDVSLYWIATH